VVSTTPAQFLGLRRGGWILFLGATLVSDHSVRTFRPKKLLFLAFFLTVGISGLVWIAGARVDQVLQVALLFGLIFLPSAWAWVEVGPDYMVVVSPFARKKFALSEVVDVTHFLGFGGPSSSGLEMEIELQCGRRVEIGVAAYTPTDVSEILRALERGMGGKVDDDTELDEMPDEG
jgi:hypothetical protein